MRRWLCCALLVLCAVTPTAAANNPRIKLKLQRATPAEAAAALARASGEKIVYQPSDRPDKQPAADPDGGIPERSDFDWNDISLARALRQMSDRFHLMATRDRLTGGVMLQSRGPNLRLKPSEKFPGFVEMRGYRFFVPQATAESRRVADFRDGAPAMGGATGRLQLQIIAEVPEGDTDPVVGLENVTARDDTGSVLMAEVRPGPRFRPRMPGNTFQDQWEETVYLSAPHPRAKKLTWVEGDLIAYQANQDRALTLPVPLPANPTSQPLGEAMVDSVKLEGRATGMEVRLSYSVPIGDDEALGTRPDLEVVLVGASGKQYPSRGGTARGDGREGRMLWDFTTTINTENDPVTQVILKRADRSRPVPVVHFRMRDIPLPPEGIFIARPAQPLMLPPRLGPRAPTPMPKPEPAPFRQAGGGVLISRILIGGKPAPRGNLSLGLSRKEDGEWGAIRWQELSVPTGETPRLPDLQPGSYRVLQAYAPLDRLNLPGPGLWRGGEVEIEAVAGKEVTLPPLEWLPDAPAAAPKPPAAKPKAPAKK